jgi:cyanophycinase
MIPRAGPVFVIGGGSAEACYIEFARLAGGADGFIVVLPHAYYVPQKAAAEEVAFFRKHGVGRVEAILPGDGKSIPADATGVFLSGGRQKRLMEWLKKPIPKANGNNQAPDTLLRQLVAYHRRGGLIGGTSAGAAALPDPMINDWTKEGEADIQEGIGVLDKLVDTHTDARPERLDRLRKAAARLRVVGIALPECGGVYIRNGHMRAVGAQPILIYHLPGRGFPRVPIQLTVGEDVALAD